MIFRLYSKLLTLAIFASLTACTSPLHKGLDLGNPAPIDKAPVSANVVKGNDVKVSVIPMKDTVELGEPVYVALRVTNTSRTAVKILGSLRPGDGLVEVYLSGVNKKKELLPPISDTDFEGSIMLKPGQTAADVIPVFYGAKGWSFKQPGDYRVSAGITYQTNEGLKSVSSEAVQIKVLAGAGSKTVVTEDGTASIEAGKFLLWRSGDHLKSGIRRLQQHSGEQPESALSSYIAAATAQSLSEPFANYTLREVRAPDCRRAAAARKSIKANVLPANLLIEDYISQAKCYALEGNWRKAKAALDAGQNIAKGRPEFAAYYRVIQQMQTRLVEYLQ